MCPIPLNLNILAIKWINDESQEFIIDCLNLFSQSNFDCNKSKFLLVIGRTNEYTQIFGDLLKFAYDSESQQFFQNIE